MKKVIYISVLLSFFIGAQVFGRPEIWLRVYESDGSTLLAANVQIYRESIVGSGYVLLYNVNIGASSIDNGANAVCDMVYSEDTGNATWPALEWKSTYLIKIQDKYCKIVTGYYWLTGSPDITITYIEGGVFSSVETPPNYKITMASQGNWDTKSVTVKNNFSGGKLKIDETEYNNVGSSGIFDNYGSPTFPHRIIAFNYTEKVNGYKRYFQNWSDGGGLNDQNLQTSINAVPATYTANFLRECDLSFENKFIGLSNCGTMMIEGVTKTLPTLTYYKNENNTIQAAAVNQTINGIEYAFNHWNDGTQNYYTATKTFTADSHRTYKAYFVGKPTNSGKNVQITSSVGQPITLTWTDINNNYVSYKIYRNVKHDGVSGAEELLASVNKGVETYTDYEYVKTASYVDLVHYDVRGYYSVEQTYSDQNWIAVYGESYIRMQQNDNNMFVGLANELPIEYSISNYPNPFNPTTTIKYQLPAAGKVTLKVYDLLGKEVAELVNEQKEAGYYEVNFDANDLTSGVYIYTIRSGKYIESKKMIFTK
ncbi:MAG: T9SS type A sorting domain-containing protein [Bacteroidota bacterium]